MANLMDTSVLIPESLFLPIGLSQAMESISQTQRQVAQLVENFIFPMQQMQKTITSMMEPILQVQRTLENSPFLKMMEEIQEANKRMAQFMTICPIFPYFGMADVIDGEFTDKKEGNSLLQAQAALMPQESLPPVSIIPLPIIQTKVKVRYLKIFEDFQIAFTIEGRFYHDGRLLKNISTNSRHGQFFLLLLEAENNYC